MILACTSFARHHLLFCSSYRAFSHKVSAPCLSSVILSKVIDSEPDAAVAQLLHVQLVIADLTEHSSEAVELHVTVAVAVVIRRVARRHLVIDLRLAVDLRTHLLGGSSSRRAGKLRAVTRVCATARVKACDTTCIRVMVCNAILLEVRGIPTLVVVICPCLAVLKRMFLGGCRRRFERQFLEGSLALHALTMDGTRFHLLHVCWTLFLHVLDPQQREEPIGHVLRIGMR
mmetsp:Transcript_42441/g.133695  ORF Transcript_42441/g.133695 Transcript_42441/m.133695 type:complete len:230 (-) Transcript_42441:1538-2227(-)